MTNIVTINKGETMWRLKYKIMKIIGSFLFHYGNDGHSRLCRVLSYIAHYGPHGTFVCLDRVGLESGGNLCSFGVQCGEPTKSYMLHMNEAQERFRLITKALKESGGLVCSIIENPNTSSSILCQCGNQEEKRFDKHSPLCPYREKWGCQPTFNEYREAVNSHLPH